MTSPVSSAPLRGVKVLDLTRLLPGPVCSMHLADMGADVVKLEDTGAGDYAPPAMRALVNRNKRGIQLDLKTAEGVAAFLQLARGADVVIESFRPGVTRRLGVDFEAVRAVNPRIVYCSISGYGQDGPYRELAGHDLNYCGYAGVADQVGVDAATPALSNVPMADLMGGALTSAMGILAALFDVQRGGPARHLDIAMADGVLAHAVMPLATLASTGQTRPAGEDTLSGGLPCYGQYRTADGRFMAVGALERKFWDTLCDTVDRPDWKAMHRRPAQAARLRAEMVALFASQPLAHWTVLFQDTDCCVSPVLKLEEALQTPLFRARGMVVDTQHPHYGASTQVACPVRMSGFEFRIERLAPLPGEHTEEVLREAGIPLPQAAPAAG